jgi:hypothetical protein
MKKSCGAVLCAAVLTALVVGVAAPARADEPRVKVPFAFIVGGKELPPGDYVVRPMSDGSAAVGIVSADGREFAWTLTSASISEQAGAARPALVFKKVGNHYFLSDVELKDGAGRQVVLTPPVVTEELRRVERHAAN